DGRNPSLVSTRRSSDLDTTKPVVSTALNSLDRIVECSDAAGLSAALNLAPSATDNCGTVTIHLVSDTPVTDPSCAQGYTRTRIWNLTSECVNTSLGLAT